MLRIEPLFAAFLKKAAKRQGNVKGFYLFSKKRIRKGFKKQKGGKDLKLSSGQWESNP